MESLRRLGLARVTRSTTMQLRLGQVHDPLCGSGGTLGVAFLAARALGLQASGSLACSSPSRHLTMGTPLRLTSDLREEQLVYQNAFLLTALPGC
jgi:hypothetical protein